MLYISEASTEHAERLTVRDRKTKRQKKRNIMWEIKGDKNRNGKGKDKDKDRIHENREP